MAFSTPTAAGDDVVTKAVGDFHIAPYAATETARKTLYTALIAAALDKGRTIGATQGDQVNTAGGDDTTTQMNGFTIVSSDQRTASLSANVLILDPENLALVRNEVILAATGNQPLSAVPNESGVKPSLVAWHDFYISNRRWARTVFYRAQVAGGDKAITQGSGTDFSVVSLVVNAVKDGNLPLYQTFYFDTDEAGLTTLIGTDGAGNTNVDSGSVAAVAAAPAGNGS